jgi:hypothetical protein
MGRTCSMHGEDLKCVKIFFLKTQKCKDLLRVLGVHIRIILKSILKKQSLKFVDWIHLDQDI